MGTQFGAPRGLLGFVQVAFPPFGQQYQLPQRGFGHGEAAGFEQQESGGGRGAAQLGGVGYAQFEQRLPGFGSKRGRGERDGVHNGRE